MTSLISYSPEITLPWADGEYTFRIAIKERLEIELQIGRRLAQISPDLAMRAGLPTILQRVASRQWLTEDLTVVLLQCLIGAGEVTPQEARRLVDTWGPASRPDDESVMTVLQILSHAVLIPEELKEPDGPKKDEAADGTLTTSDSPLPKSTAPEPSSPSLSKTVTP